MMKVYSISLLGLHGKSNLVVGLSLTSIQNSTLLDAKIATMHFHGKQILVMLMQLLYLAKENFENKSRIKDSLWVTFCQVV